MERFEKTSSDIIIDHSTGLEWQAEATEQRMTWDEAMKYAESLGNGWKLPSCLELYSLVNLEKACPASDFPGMPSSSFWSSSSRAASASSAWFVAFDYGYVGSVDKTFDSYARCVRGGPLEFGPLNQLRTENDELQVEIARLRGVIAAKRKRYS